MHRRNQEPTCFVLLGDWCRVQTGAIVFVDIYFSSLETVPRADVEALLEDRLPLGCEIVGAGVGVTGSNIDLEITDRTAVAAILDALRSLDVRADTMLAFSDTGAKVTLEELL
jgi:hypothetical protein